MSKEKAKITIEENLILSENHNDISNNKEIKIEEASIDELIDIIKGYIHHNNPTSISKKAELVKALFYKQLNKSFNCVYIELLYKFVRVSYITL